MLALTIKQPWAWAILNAEKDIENRTWATNVRGPIAIHASKKMEDWEFTEFVNFSRELIATNQLPPFLFPSKSELITGAILGTVEIVGCVKQSDSPWFMGDYGFVLENPKILLNPIPCRGALGFWQVPSEFVSQIIEETQEF